MGFDQPHPMLDGLKTREALFGLSAIVAGMMLYAWLSHYPAAFIVVPVIILLGLAPVLVWGRALELRCFLLSTGVCVLLASLGYGLTTVTSDADDFFRLAATANIHESIASLAVRVNAPLAVVIWRYLYYAFGVVGISAAPAIGTTFNAVLVGLSGAMTVAAIRRVFPGDRRSHNFALYAYAFAGSPVMFGSIHLRDVFVLFFTTVAVYAWARAVTSKGLRSTWQAVVVSAVTLPFIYFIRTESVYGVVLLTMAGFVIKTRRKFGLGVSLVITLLPLMAIAYILRADLLHLLDFSIFRNAQYTEASMLSSSQGSLGYKYIIDRALPVKLALGSVYMLYFPIPIWTGFFGDFYTFLVTWNGIYMYFFAPFLIASTVLVWRSAWINADFSNCCLLMSFAFWGNFFAVIATSFENRHIGPMAGAMVITATAIVNAGIKYRRKLKSLRILWISGAVLLHVFWRIIK